MALFPLSPALCVGEIERGLHILEKVVGGFRLESFIYVFRCLGSCEVASSASWGKELTRDSTTMTQYRTELEDQTCSIDDPALSISVTQLFFAYSIYTCLTAGS